MVDIEMIDIENPDHGNGGDKFVQAQPNRRIFLSLREKYGMPPNENHNPDGVVAAAEPQQRSRYAFLCFAAFVALFVAAAFVTFMCICLRSNPTTSRGWDLFFAGLTIGTIGLVIIAPCGLGFVGYLAEEVIDGNPEGRRTIYLFM
jgi:hypothetical protein